MYRPQLHIALICCALLWSLTARPASAMEVAGELSGHTRWSGEVLLTQEVVVLAGARLEIAPGTRVRAATAASVLRIYGALEVAGQAEAPVEFLTPHGWQGIVFERPDQPARIRYARFSGAATALTASGAEVQLEQVTFRECRTAVKGLREAHLRVRDSRFENNQIGVDAELKSRLTLQGCLFEGQAQAGARVATGSHLKLSDCRFVGNGAGLVLQQKITGAITASRFLDNDRGLVGTRTGAGLEVRGNLFENNRIALESETFSQFALSDNRFVRNQTAVKSDQFATGEFLHNLFEGNRTALKNTRRADPRVARNVFYGNEVAVYCDFSSYPRLHDNNFVENPLAVKLGPFQSAAGARLPGAQREVGMIGPGPGAALNSPPDSIQDFIDASANWWGMDTPQLAAAGAEGNPSIFFDRRDQAEVELTDGAGGGLLDQVRFSPWLNAPVADAGPR
ncbi:right-handed parallel beta-helix repeat-containing protein [Geoalkalibacter halelectricus]|uniref:right-handed parallel beta-helix repeat-containing protein n=1 Tax=Geoalkalibacter halelectricus TaxID=2847045 RepID=UPI003D191F5E